MMKALNEYMAMPYHMKIIEVNEEEDFAVSYPDLQGCITCGRANKIDLGNMGDESIRK